MVNKVILLGNVGKDPEIKDVGDSKVARFSMATSETFNKDGEKKTITDWHNVVAWDKLAELADSYIEKGKQLYVEGKIKTRSYESNGEKKYVTEIVANSIRLLGSRGDSQMQKMEPKRDVSVGPVNDDDLPF